MQTRLGKNITISTFYYVLVSTKVTAVWSAMASCSSIPQFLLHFHSILLTTGAGALQLEHEVLLGGLCPVTSKFWYIAGAPAVRTIS